MTILGIIFIVTGIFGSAFIVVENQKGSLHFLSIIAIIIGTVLMCLYTVNEGERTIVKRFGAVTHVSEPGLHFKTPIADSLVTIEVRTRKALVENEQTSTVDQLPSRATISVNWSVHTNAVAQLFAEYGSLNTLERRVLYPKMRSALKVAVAKYTAEEVNRNRNLIVTSMTENLRNELKGFPLTISSVQLENIMFPHNYIEAIEAKQTELQRVKEEEHRLAKQLLRSKQAINTANSQAEAKKISADAEAYKIRATAEAEADKIQLEGKAQAVAIKEQGEALRNNPLLVDLRKAESWNGQLPTTNLGGNGGANFLFGLNK